MKKILFVMPVTRPGGAGSALASLYNCIEKDKYDIEVFPMVESSVEERERLPYCNVILQPDKLLDTYCCNFREKIGLSKIKCFSLQAFCKILSKIGIDVKSMIYHHATNQIERRKKYDIVIGYLEGSTTQFSSYFRCPDKIAWVHVDYNQYLSPNQTEELLYSQFRNIVTVADYTTRIFNERYPSLAARTLTIHNPLDVNRVLSFSIEPIDDNRFVQDGTFSIISVGRIAEIKRFSLIPEIVSKLKDINLRWYIIGPNRNQTEYDLICTNIKKYGLEDKVIMLGPKLNPYPYFKAANLLISTSRSEACPMIFNEARVLGLPVMSADYPAAFEFIKNENNGIICPIENMADLIKRMVTDRLLYERIRNNSTFSSIDNDNIVAQFYNLID